MEVKQDRLLIIVEDDAILSRTLGRSFERRGYDVLRASNLEDMNVLLNQYKPNYAVVDL